jgi:hypothetical protein
MRPIQLGSSRGTTSRRSLLRAPAQVDRDHQVGAERATHRHRHRVDQPAVDQHRPVAHHRRQQARHRARRAHRFEQLAVAQPQLAPGLQLGGDRAVGNGQLVDLAVGEHRAEQGEEARAADQAAAPGKVHQAQHGGPGDPGDPFLQPVELARRIGAPHQRADRGAADDVGLDAALLERADHADVRPAARAAGAEGESETEFAAHAPPV